MGLLLRQDHAILARDGPHRDGEHLTAKCNDAIHLWMQPFNGSGSRLPVRPLASQIKVRALPAQSTSASREGPEYMWVCLTSGTVEALYE